MLKKVFVIVFAVLWYGSAFAAHPLITDDAGTQGKEKYQLEVNGEYGNEKYGVDGEKNTTKMATTLTYGASENMDIILGIPYQYIRTKTPATDMETASTKAEDGISDISIESKWKFFEKDGLSLALKPGITLPAGDRKRGLGTGRTAYSLFFITTKEVEPWAFHFNLGYKRNENRNNERIEIWHASAASELEVLKDLRVVVNIGTERNPDKASNLDPAFILGGLIYSISKNFDIDFGIRGGLNKPETDYAILAGIVWRF